MFRKMLCLTFVRLAAATSEKLERCTCVRRRVYFFSRAIDY